MLPRLPLSLAHWMTIGSAIAWLAIAILPAGSAEQARSGYIVASS